MASGMIGFCRICAQKKQDLVSVFSEDGICLQLHLKLEICLHIEVLKNDHLPNAICIQCLAKLEACYQLFELRLKGEDKLKRYQRDLIDLSKTSNNFESVMHGEHKLLLSVKMEEDIFDHPKRRKMRRHMQGGANTAVQNVMEPPQQENERVTCQCVECSPVQYGGLPLLAHVSSQQQPEHNVVRLNNPGININYAGSGSSLNNYSGAESEPSHYSRTENSSSFPQEDSSPKSYLQMESGSNSFVRTESATSNLAEMENTPKMYFDIQPSPTSQVLGFTSEPSAAVARSPPSRANNSPTRDETSGTASSPRKEIPCDFCGKTFTHTGDLNKHRRIHTGERPYKCTQCERKFSHASNLLRHRKIHSGERPFICSLCGKGFSRKDKMLNHRKSATCSKRSDSNLSSPGPSRE